MEREVGDVVHQTQQTEQHEQQVVERVRVYQHEADVPEDRRKALICGDVYRLEHAGEWHWDDPALDVLSPFIAAIDCDL